MADIWYRLRRLPDLTLNKYASLEEKGVDGVLQKHIAFLRQLDRRGIVSGVSFHLFYYYYQPEDPSLDTPGSRLRIFLMVRGREEALRNIGAFISASPLSEFYPLEQESGVPEEIARSAGFKSCAVLTKSETLLPGAGEEGSYRMLRPWEMNGSGRLYNMCRMMEALGSTVLYRVDLYPVERSTMLREQLRRPMDILRRRQDDRSSGKDHEGKEVLKSYEDLLGEYESSPHFIANIMVFSPDRENGVTVLDAAGSESLLGGKYEITSFAADLSPMSFLEGENTELDNIRAGMVMRKGNPGLIVCRSDTAELRLNYLPVMLTLEEVEPFFRFPALYDGEVIQIPKETAPDAVDKSGGLLVGRDKNGYDVYFPVKLLPKHAFVSGVPGSGKTNTMHHLTSSLWQSLERPIPFLVLEPAKQEYRALLNDPGMKDMYLFSPNADMSFPLHINPFEMPKGTMVAEHIRRLCSVFEGAFPLEPPMPFLLDTAIEAVYRETGWIPEHIYTGEELQPGGKHKRRLPTMSMLYRRLEQELENTKYSGEVRGNLESALKVRIGSLLRREMGDVFDVPYSTFEPERWLEVPAVIELEAMGTGPANFLTLMLCSLIRETLKAAPVFDGPVRHVIFIEEAHNLIGPESEEQTGADADPKTAATAFVVKMLAEVRALKEGIIIADQLPTVMAQEVLKNTGLKIGLRITSADDRQLLGSTMAASALQLEQMATYEVGESLMFYEKVKRPFNVRVKEWCGEKPDKEELTTPKNDRDLREALRDNAAYRDANERSIEIICTKFGRLVDELKNGLDEDMNYLRSLADLRDGCRRLYEGLEAAENGRRTVDEAVKKREYAQYNELSTRYKKELGDTAKRRRMADRMGTFARYMSSIERLKNGRWERFGLSDRWRVRADIIQLGIDSSAGGLLQRIVEVFGDMPELSQYMDDLEAFPQIALEVNEEITDLVNRNGTDALKELLGG